MTEEEWNKRIKLAEAIIETGVRSSAVLADDIIGGERLAAVTVVVQRCDDGFRANTFCTYMREDGGS